MRNERHYSQVYVHGSVPEYENDGDPLDEIYIPDRSYVFGINRPDTVVVLPDSLENIVYVSQMDDVQNQLGNVPPNTLLVPEFSGDSYYLDKRIDAQLGLMKGVLKKGVESTVYPYANNIHLRTWVSKLKSEGYELRISMPKRVYFDELDNPQQRGVWGRWVSNPDELSFAQRNGIPYPTAFVGQGLGEIREAYERVVIETGRDDVYFKPIFSAGGFTLAKITSIEELETHYNLLIEQGRLDLFDQEIPVEMQSEVQYVRGFASIQYDGKNNMTPGGVTIQIMNGDEWGGNMFNVDMTEAISAQSQALFERIVAGYANEGRELGKGGFGFPVVENDTGELEVIVLEHNGDREVGANPAIVMANVFGVADQPFLIRKVGNPKSDLKTMWDAISQDCLAYDSQTKKGVYPLVWVEGSGFLFATGESESAIMQMTDQVRKLVSKNGYSE